MKVKIKRQQINVSIAESRAKKLERVIRALEKTPSVMFEEFIDSLPDPRDGGQMTA